MKIETGTKIEFIQLPPITKEQLRAYAEASGDFNPIHLDEAVAKKSGLPGIIAHGMLTSGFLAERAMRFMTDEAKLTGKFKLVKFQNRFKGMTLLGDVISIGGTVKEATETTIVLDLQAKNQKGEITTTGIASFAS